MAEETDRKLDETKQGLTRREALLQLLRVGGTAAVAAGAAVWLSKHSFRPLPAQAEQARRDQLLRRLDVVGLRLNEAADALADAAVKRRA